MTPDEIFDASLTRSSAAAIDHADKAWQRSRSIAPAQRAEFLERALVDVAVTHGDVAAADATIYVRALMAGDEALAALDTTPRPADLDYLRESVRYAMQTKTEGLVDDARDARVRDLIHRVIEKHVRRRGLRHVNVLARRMGKKAAPAAEHGACGFCMGRAAHGAMPPYHRDCRCSVRIR